MRDSNSSQNSPQPAETGDTGFTPWRRLKSKRISYLTLPLLVMATITEFVILATGWRYQQVVCVPKGMGVTFFGIGPIGATILAVELLKLPLAIWTASRNGWQKTFMLLVGLPLICVLTFQLVKDMAVYEMGVAMTPASQFLEKAIAEETQINQLNGQLAAIEGKKKEREQTLAELAAKENKAKADLDELLKRNDDQRKDAISLTDYQKKELSEVDLRESSIIAQFSLDTAQLTKQIADLRTAREPEVERAARWNAEEARIENAYKAKLSDYQNKKAAYDKDKAAYDNAGFLKRQLMKEPIDPGVPPVRESNLILKPASIAEIDTQIAAKQAELQIVNTKRRDRVAQVETDARKLREEFDQRSTNKREQADKKRDDLMAAQTALASELKAERKEADVAVVAAVKNVDSIRADIDAARKRAEGYYDQREASIRATQVHRIATTVEIVRGLIKGERPASIKASAKERGDILTDQISMVRIWVYPVLAFIVAFLPTLMVEIGFSTVFHPEKARPGYRMGFMGRRLHWLYTRAGRFKIARAERIAAEANGLIAARDRIVASTKANAEKALGEKTAELYATRESLAAATAEYKQQWARREAEYSEQFRAKEEEWVAKLAGMADSLNRTVIEKDSLKDFQKSEIERQVQSRQNAWSDRLSQLRQELESQRAAFETERTTLMQEQQQRLTSVTEECKSQVNQSRRQLAEAELGGVEKSGKLAHDLKEAVFGRHAAEAQLKQQAEAFALKLAEVQETTARERETAARQEKHRHELQQLEFENTRRQRDEALEQKLKQREQELTQIFSFRIAEEKGKVEQEARAREAERERHTDSRTRDLETYWNQENQKREETAQAKLKQREQQLQLQTDLRVREAQSLAEEQARRRELEHQREIETQSRTAETRLRDELQQKDAQFLAKLKQREQEWASRADSRSADLQKQWAADMRTREEDWERRAESRSTAAESRLAEEAEQKEELFQNKLRQRDQQWQAKLDAAKVEWQAQSEEVLRRRSTEAENALRELEGHLLAEAQQKEEAAAAQAKQREQEIVATVTAQTEAGLEAKIRASIESFRALLVRAEKERDESRQSAFEAARQVEHMAKRLTEASSYLSDWKG